MKAIDFLNQIRLLNYKIDDIDERLIRVRQSLLYKETTYEDIGGGGGGGSNSERTPKLLAIEEQFVDRYKELVKQKEQVTVDILNVIDKLDCIDQNEVLYWLYVQDKTVAEASHIMARNEKWIYRKRNSGIDEVQKILDHRRGVTPKTILLFDTFQHKVVAEGTNKEIADLLGITPYAVTAHVVQEIPYLHFDLTYKEGQK